MSQLAVTVGHTSLNGPRPRNEDFCGAVTPEGSELDAKGVIVAVADGVGGHVNGREASEYTVRGLLSDYYATPQTWSVPKSLETVIAALNRWLVAQSAKTRETAGMATTLSALVLKGRRFSVAHVGDSRIYRLREGRLTQLTTDHVWEHPELKNVLSRAIGLDQRVQIDFSDGDLAVGDVFALMSDGVWSQLGDTRVQAILADHPDPQEAASRLAMQAEDGGSKDNCTALVLRVEGLPKDGLLDAIARIQSLPLPPVLKPGQTLDGLTVEEVLHESRVTLLYRVRTPAGAQRVLKTLRPEADDPQSTAALAHEEWLAGRVVDTRFPQVVPHPGRNFLYYLMSWHEGASLKARLAAGQRFAPTEAAALGIEILKGLAILHRLSIVHRDIKPDNLHLGADGRLRILDLGVAASDGQEETQGFSEINNPGTPSYMAPELFSGSPADVSTDLYAVGVTLFELLTRKYPYGEIEPFQKPRFADPLPPTRFRPDIPQWLEAVLLKAVARDRQDRFETAEEFLLALERGAHRPLAVPRRMPLLKRDPQLGLKLLAAASLALNLLLVYLLLAR
ncbi:MAG: bifunctional protein-serine/threonine kinase/phosphatase [Rhodocyclaceae bacterium]|jgi:protein phosphatase|nr:bifunctional protein-serine/threonine kinase/phosphatase [Rhodocyclaceae bacterium]